jgi:hypothetical protein
MFQFIRALGFETHSCKENKIIIDLFHYHIGKLKRKVRTIKTMKKCMKYAVNADDDYILLKNTYSKFIINNMGFVTQTLMLSHTLTF